MRWKNDNLGNWKTADDKYMIIRDHGYRVYVDGELLGDCATFRDALRMCLDREKQGDARDLDADGMAWMRRD